MCAGTDRLDIELLSDVVRVVLTLLAWIYSRPTITWYWLETCAYACDARRHLWTSALIHWWC